ncbi:MAG TPA: dual specificity protein phosphatase [Gemmatimonadales bacterium]|nr:dual specificity protein phosphatase [Gemmatimonadales bacterium]
MRIVERLLDGWLGRQQVVRDAYAWRLRLHNMLIGNRPTEVEPGGWISGVPSQSTWRTLETAGVTHVVSLLGEHTPPRWLESAASVLWLPVRDRKAPTLSQLRAGVEFLEAARAAGHRVLVFCGTGSGRAPTMYAAWLLARDGGTPHQVIEALHARRAVVLPTPKQLAALEAWTSELATTR